MPLKQLTFVRTTLEDGCILNHSRSGLRMSGSAGIEETREKETITKLRDMTDVADGLELVSLKLSCP